jgi:cytochrome oxidase assembly protein ShyY1
MRNYAHPEILQAYKKLHYSTLNHNHTNNMRKISAGSYCFPNMNSFNSLSLRLVRSVLVVLLVLMAQAAFTQKSPDIPDFARFKADKVAFMQRRAEGIALKRGIDKNHPFSPVKRGAAILEMKMRRISMATRRTSSQIVSLSSPWTEIGPNPIPNGQVNNGSPLAVSGRTIAIAVHPTNPNIVYVGTAQGGLYRTLDGGSTWTTMMDNALSLAIGAVAISPSSPETIYVGTGEGNFSADSYFGVGVYRIDNASSGSPVLTGPLNRDAGNTDIFSGNAISKIVVHPTNPATIFVSATSGIGGIGAAFQSPLPSQGIYRSTNATAANPTFAKLTGLESGGNFPVRDMVVDPLNADLLVCSLVASGGGIYVSTNALAGAPTFTRRLQFTGTTNDVNAELAIQHTIGAANPTIYAATGFGGGRVYINTDGGTVWTQQIDNNFCTPQCFYDIAIAVDPTNPAKVYLGGAPNLVFGVSTNSAVTFTANATTANGLHADSHAIGVSPSSPSTIYFGSDGGIYKSTNSGTTWATLNNTTFRATQFMSLALHPTDPNYTIGGTQDNGTNMYKPDGTWNRVDFGDGGYAAIDQNATDVTNVTMYHTYFNQTNAMGYGRVTTTATAFDNGWTLFGCGFAGSVPNGMTCAASAILFYAPMETGPGNPNTLYFGSDVLYRSSNGGTSVTKVSQEPITAGVAISAIGISRQNDNVRIVGLANGGIFGTTTGSSTLINLDAGNVVPSGFVARAVIDPNNVNTAYITLSVFDQVSIWKTTNLNSATPTWTNAATGVPNIPVNAFVVDPVNSNNLFAGTDIGVYASSDGGASWDPFGTGLPAVAVFDMAIHPVTHVLRIATHGRGMWQNTITNANQAPVVTTSPGTTTYTEDNPPVLVDNGLTVTDPDNVNLASATVSITGNFQTGQDVLAFLNQNGITGVYNAATGVLSLTGSSALVNYQTALRSVTYNNSSQNPNTSNRTVSFVASDGTANSNTATKTIVVVAVNDAPVVTTSVGNTTYTEDNPPVAVDNGLTVADVDNTNLASATVSITGNFQTGQDVLTFSNQNGITGVYNSGTGVLTLTGSSTIANYQIALRSVTYNNSSQNPNTSNRTVSFVASDGTANSNTATKTIVVVAVNDAPVVTTSVGNTTYTEDNPPVAVDNVLTVADVDNTNLASATVSITGNFQTGQDVLAFTTQNGITGVYNSGTGVLTLTGSSSVANYQTALRSVTYNNSSQNPNTSNRTVSFVANDGTANSNTATKIIVVVAVNDAPVVTTSVGNTTYTEDAPPVAIDNALTVTDVDNANLSSAIVSITGNFLSTEDVLAFTNQNGITGVYNSVTGVLTLTGSATVANYQTALRSVTYNNSSQNPNTSNRNVSFVANDGTTNSNTANKIIIVVAVNDAPVVTTSPGNTTYTEDNPPVAVDNALTVVDPDNANLASATVSITGNFQTGQDVLAFLNQNGITGVYNSGTGVLTLTGSSSVANYQTALRSVTYNNSSQNPNTSNRTVSFVASDGTANSNTATKIIVVVAVNDAPVITSNGGGPTATISVPENTTAVTTVVATDPDGTTPTYSIFGGTDALKFSINAASGALTFIAAPDFEAPTDAGPNNVYDVVVRATDGILNDDQAIAVTVTDVNEAPAQVNHLVISMVHGASGGCFFPNYLNGVELFNPTSAPISLNGYSVQYANGTSTNGLAQVRSLPNFSLQPGQYFLIVEYSPCAVGPLIPPPDVAGTGITMTPSGKVFLVNNTVPLVIGISGCPVASIGIIDFVGYGSTNCYEGTGSASTGPITRRNGGGCIDTDNNLADFTAVPLAIENIRNSSSPFNICSAPGAALNFDGLNDFVSIPHNVVLNAFPLTAEAWIKTSVSKFPAGIISKYVSGDGWRIYQNLSNLTATINVASSSCTVNSSGQSIADGAWHHVAFTADASGGKIYIDGILRGTATWTGAPGIPTNTAPVSIGFYSGAVGTEYFEGNIDEVRIWNRALCVGEIINNRTCEVSSTGGGLKANYHFNQGLAAGNNAGVTTLTDASGNAFNGTLNNFALTGPTSNWVAPGGVATGVSCGAFLAPEINVQGNSTTIVDGDITPSLTDHTDFGGVSVGGNVVRTYTIENTGTGNLTVTGITMTGADAAMFAVGVLTPASPLPPAGTATFTVTFTPTSTGLKTATVNIANSDCDEGTYDFAVRGTSLYTIDITLSGAQEVPPNPSTGLGNFVGTYNDVTNELSFQLMFAGLSSPTTAAHLHAPAPPGVNAPVVIGFAGFPTGVTSGSYSNTYILTEAQEAQLLCGQWYVNVHTTTYPGGEIRGQVKEAPSMSFDITMAGSQEVPPNPSTGVGNLSGTYNAATNQLSFQVAFTGLTSPTTAAHFHAPAASGVNAPVVIGFAGFPVGVTSGSYSNTYTLTDAQETQLLAGLWYVNIHTSGSPGGEIRGQLQEGTLPGNCATAAALNFDGVDDKVIVSNSSVNLANSSFSVEMWLQRGTPGTYDIAFSQGGNIANNQTLHIGFRDNGNFTFAFFGNDLDVPGLSDALWHHWACTFDNVTKIQKVYRDGVLVGQQTSSSSFLGSGNTNLIIGDVAYGLGNFFNGNIDELRIWNTTRTCDQVSQLRNCELAGSESGLLAYYKFNQGVAGGNNAGVTTLTDATANANNGTLNNFALTGATSNWVAPGGVTSGISCGAVTPAPEINVQGNATTIVDGDATPSLADHTDFGGVNVGGNVVRTFTIQNTGTGSLAVSSINISGADAAQFAVGSLTPASPIPAAGSATFTVTFTPASSGVKNATVNINSNDCDEALYDYAIKGSGDGGPCAPDNQDPVLVTKNKTVNLDATGHASIVPADVIQTLSDNCDPNPGVQLSRSTFSCADITSTPVVAGNHQAYNVSTSTGNQGWEGELGLVFKVNNPQGIYVKQLGTFDHLGNGIFGSQGVGNNSIHVAIFYASTHNIVPGLDVFITGNADAYTGNHRMKNIPPVMLAPGTYVLVAKGYNATERNGNRNIPGIPANASDLNDGNGAISFIGSSYGNNTPVGFVYPANGYAPVNPWIAGTFKFDIPTGGVIVQNTVSITVTATDNNGNDVQQNATVTVEDPNNVCSGISACTSDNTPPVLVTKNKTVQLDATGHASIVSGDVIQSLSDNCDPNPGRQLSRSTFSCADIVTTPASAGNFQAYNVGTSNGNQGWQGELGLEFKVNNPQGIVVKQLGAFDDKGNGISGSQGVSLNSIHVAIFNKSTQTIVAGLNEFITGNADAYTGNHRMKNVAPVTLPPGNYVLVAKGYSATELNGNRSLSGIPTNASDLQDGNGAITFVASSYGEDMPDNSFTYPAHAFGAINPWIAGTFKYDVPTGGTTVNNTVTITITATDNQGNATQKTAVVTVEDPGGVCNGIPPPPCEFDNTPPVLVTKNKTVNLDATGNASIVPADVIQTLSDNCDPNPGVQLSRSTFSCADIVTSPAGAGNFQAYNVGASTGNQGWEGELGLEFKVNNAQGIIIKQLGAFDHQGNGITGSQGVGNNSIHVAIFNKSTQAIVGGLDVFINGNADAYTGNHRMKNINPVTLPPGNYVLVAKGYNATEQNGNRNLAGIPSSAADLNDGNGAISFIASSYGNNTPVGFTYPANPYPQINPWIAGTMKFDVPTGGSITTNTVTITVTATDNKGNATQRNAVVTVEDPTAACSAPPIANNTVHHPVKSVAIETMDMKVYPDPTTGRFTVRLVNMTVPKVRIEVQSTTGRTIATKSMDLSGKTASLSVPFDISNHASGMYFIRVITSEGIQTMKMLLQH